MASHIAKVYPERKFDFVDLSQTPFPTNRAIVLLVVEYDVERGRINNIVDVRLQSFGVSTKTTRLHLVDYSLIETRARTLLINI